MLIGEGELIELRVLCNWECFLELGHFLTKTHSNGVLIRKRVLIGRRALNRIITNSIEHAYKMNKY